MRRENIAKTLYYRKILQNKPIYLEIAEKYKKNNENLSVSEEIYLYVMAPTLIEYIRWVIAQAKKDGIRKLYFLSRDGYQMYLVAKSLIKSMGMKIECRYLNVSRYALRVPEYYLIKEKCLERICIGGIDVTFEMVMRRAGLNDDEIFEIAKMSGYENDYKKVISYRQVQELKDILKDNKKFFEYVYSNSKRSYDNTIGFLKQEGLFEDIPYAIVDSGWIGTMQQTLGNLLASGGKDDSLTGYYFGLYETPKDSKEIYKSYYFTKRNGLKRKVNFSNCLFEAIFTSPEGMTLCYNKTHSGYEPVYDNVKNPNSKQISENIELLKRYLNIYNFLSKDNKYKNTKNYEIGFEMISKLLSSFMGTPSEAEVESYGNNMFSDDVLQGKLKKVAEELSDEDIKNQRIINKILIMTGIKKKTIHESAWIEGSIVRRGKNIKSNLIHARMYKYLVYIRKL